MYMNELILMLCSSFLHCSVEHSQNVSLSNHHADYLIKCLLFQEERQSRKRVADDVKAPWEEEKERNMNAVIESYTVSFFSLFFSHKKREKIKMPVEEA